MADGELSQPAAEYSAAVMRPCRFCEAPVTQPTGRNRNTKEFCSSQHRAAYREQEHQKALALAVEAIDNAEAAVAQSMAQLQGAKLVLQRFQKKKTRKGK